MTGPPVVETYDPSDPLLTSTEVARIFAVNPKTVTRWALEGRVEFIRTPGGHRRFRRSAIAKLIEEGSG